VETPAICLNQRKCIFQKEEINVILEEVEIYKHFLAGLRAVTQIKQTKKSGRILLQD